MTVSPSATYWESVIKMNNYQKRRFAMKIVSSMFNTVSGKRLAVLGFAFKKNTSDIRFSASIDVCKTLLAEKAVLCVHDPRVSSEAIGLSFTDDAGAEKLLTIEADPYMALQGAHAIVVLTEWDQFTRLDFRRVYAAMQRPAFVFDGHNLLDHAALRDIGFVVFGIGKPPPPKPAGESAEMNLEAELKTQKERAAKMRIRVGAERVPSSTSLSEMDEGAASEIADSIVDLLDGDSGEASPIPRLSPHRTPPTSPQGRSPSGPPTFPDIPEDNATLRRLDTFGGMM